MGCVQNALAGLYGVKALILPTAQGVTKLRETVILIHDKSADEELVRMAQKGELAAMDELTRRHEKRVYTLAWRMLRHEQDAEDVTQQAFLSALEHLDGFRGESTFSTWLLRIASHAALKLIRKRQGLKTVSLDESTESEGDESPIPHPEFIADWRFSPDRLAGRSEIFDLLEAALVELEEKHRVVFLLRDVEGFSVKETAEALGITEANVKVRLLRARLQLRERLTRELGDPQKALKRHQHA